MRNRENHKPITYLITFFSPLLPFICSRDKKAFTVHVWYHTVPSTTLGRPP